MSRTIIWYNPFNFQLIEVIANDSKPKVALSEETEKAFQRALKRSRSQQGNAKPDSMIYNDYEQKYKGLRAASRQTCKKKKPPSPDKQGYIGGS